LCSSLIAEARALGLCLYASAASGVLARSLQILATGRPSMREAGVRPVFLFAKRRPRHLYQNFVRACECVCECVCVCVCVREREREREREMEECWGSDRRLLSLKLRASRSSPAPGLYQTHLLISYRRSSVLLAPPKRQVMWINWLPRCSEEGSAFLRRFSKLLHIQDGRDGPPCAQEGIREETPATQ